MRHACLLLVVLAGCSRHGPAPPAEPHYTIGAPYQSGGLWHYPRESFRYEATGLAVRLPDRTGLTADGERYDPAALAAAHATLQLPAIALVTNLENGRALRVRINDRGPDEPGRLLGLTPRAADLLGLPSSGATQIRLEVDSAASQALRDQLHAGPANVAAAPITAVSAQDLPPPGSSRPAAESRILAAPDTTPDRIPDRLPETVMQGTPQPGQLWLQIGTFSDRRYAQLVAARLPALPIAIRRLQAGRSPQFGVAAGPFLTVPQADAALDQARAAGVTDAVIVVE